MRELDHSEISQFVLEEYKQARLRITSDIDEINKSEIFYLSIMGLVYWFIFSVKPQNMYLIAFFLLLPVVISIYSMLRYTAHRYVIKTHEGYIKDWIEPYFLKFQIDPCGLATYYDSKSQKLLKPVRYLLHATLILFSISLVPLVFVYPEYTADLLKDKACNATEKAP
jgi:hypothetical protein